MSARLLPVSDLIEQSFNLLECDSAHSFVDIVAEKQTAAPHPGDFFYT